MPSWPTFSLGAVSCGADDATPSPTGSASVDAGGGRADGGGTMDSGATTDAGTDTDAGARVTPDLDCSP